MWILYCLRPFRVFSQINNQHFTEPTASLPHTVPNLSQISLVDTPSSYIFQINLILFYHQQLDFPHDFFPSGFLLKLRMHFSSLTCLIHVQPVLSAWPDHTNIIRPVWTPMLRWQENIKAGPKETGWEGVDCFLQTDDSDNKYRRFRQFLRAPTGAIYNCILVSVFFRAFNDLYPW